MEKKDDWLIVRGQVYKKEEKEKYQILYLEKMFCLFSERSTESTKSTKSAIIYKKNPECSFMMRRKIRYRLEMRWRRKGSLVFETARNPGEF